MGEPMKVEVGQRWECAGMASTVVRIENDDIRKVWLRYDDSQHDVFSPERMFIGEHPAYKLIGYAPGYGPQPPEAPKAEAVLEACADCVSIGGWFAGTKCSKHRDPESPYDRRRFSLELSKDGVALSALQVIQARKKPEPYIPSVDEWDLLPDAGR